MPSVTVFSSFVENT